MSDRLSLISQVDGVLISNSYFSFLYVFQLVVSEVWVGVVVVVGSDGFCFGVVLTLKFLEINTNPIPTKSTTLKTIGRANPFCRFINLL